MIGSSNYNIMRRSKDDNPLPDEHGTLVGAAFVVALIALWFVLSTFVNEPLPRLLVIPLILLPAHIIAIIVGVMLRRNIDSQMFNKKLADLGIFAKFDKLQIEERRQRAEKEQQKLP